MSSRFPSPPARALDRRKLLQLGGSAALMPAVALGSKTAAAQDTTEMVDLPWLSNQYGQQLADFEFQQMLYWYDQAIRRSTPVNGVDVTSGVESEWTGGGSITYVRPNQGSSHDLNWDVVIYISVDSLTTNDAADRFLANATGSLAGYNAIPVSLPDKMAANDSAATFAFPYQNDPSININRTLAGFRKRSDAILALIDSYGDPLPVEAIIMYLSSLSDLTSEGFSDVPLMPGPILVGGPGQSDMLFRRFEGADIVHFGDDQEANQASAEATLALNATSYHAASAHWSAQFTPDTPPREFFWSWNAFDDPAVAAEFLENYGEYIAASDELNSLTRTPLSFDLITGDDAETRCFDFHISGGADQFLTGQHLLARTESEILGISMLDTNVVTSVDTELTDEDIAVYEMLYHRAMAEAIERDGSWHALWSGMAEASD